MFPVILTSVLTGSSGLNVTRWSVLSGSISERVSSVAELSGGDPLAQATTAEQPVIDITDGLTLATAVGDQNLAVSFADSIATIFVLIDPSGLVDGRVIASRDTSASTDKQAFRIVARA